MEEASMSDKNLFEWISSQVCNFFTSLKGVLVWLIVLSISVSLSFNHLPIVFQHTNKNRQSWINESLIKNNYYSLWISKSTFSNQLPFYQDPKHSLHDMVQQCLKATEQLDQHVLDNLMLEVTDTFKQVDNPSMKEVKGIEDRLYGLDQILNGARKIVQEQSDLAQVKKTSSVQGLLLYLLASFIFSDFFGEEY